MTMQHKDLAQGRWALLSFVEQMANIGSEVERSLNWRGKGNLPYANMAFERALELIDMTLDSLTTKTRYRELARLREAVVDYFAGANEFGSTPSSWRGYFLPFVFLARQER